MVASGIDHERCREVERAGRADCAGIGHERDIAIHIDELPGTLRRNADAVPLVKNISQPNLIEAPGLGRIGQATRRIWRRAAVSRTYRMK